MSSRGRLSLLVVLTVLSLVGAVSLAADELPFETVFELTPIAVPDALPPIPPGFGVELVLDDDSFEGTFGVTQGAGAKQFLWFNRFQNAALFHLEEIWVLFPSSAAPAGNAIELVVYHDPDSNPANGATLLWSQSATVQVADDNTFSIYPVAPALSIPGGGDVLIGVVNRWVVSGVTPPATFATYDVTATQSRSWLAVWSGDPPASPTLPSDNVTDLLENVVGVDNGGNWLIRGFGQPASVLEIPTLAPLPMVGLVGGLLVAGLYGLRRRQRLAGGGSK